ncbi:MAG TPA: hypothetical protein DDW42_05230 [Desulfobacteraceae bacterium]|nr:hypothetical protein [Desulfobacteraceae bacterium]
MTDEDKGTQNADTNVPSTLVPEQSGDLVSTIEFRSPDNSNADTSTNDANNEDTAGQKKADSNDEGAKGDTGAQDGDKDLDKNPRFIQLNERMKLAEARNASLEAKFNETQIKPSAKDTTEEPAFKDVSKMTKEEILDWQTEDPQGYYANILAQAKQEISGDMKKDLNQRSVEDAVAGTYEQYAKDNPDFDKMWDTGEIKQYMDRNPGHNAISAHMAITGAAKTQLTVDEAVKAAEKRIMDNIRAKRENKVLSSGPSASRNSNETEITAEMRNTKEHGGLAAVLARRSLAREKELYGS